MISKFWVHGPISLWHFSFWCPFLTTSLAMSCSNKGVQLKGVTREGPHTSNLFPCVCSLWLWLTFHEASLQYYYYYYYQLILFLSISLNIATHICGCLSVMLLTALRSTQMSICGLMRLGICGSGSLHSSHLRFGLILWYAIFYFFCVSSLRMPHPPCAPFHILLQNVVT